MANNYKYYPQDPLVNAATLTADVGTSSTLDNVLNNRKASRLDVDTVTGSAFRFLLDVGSGNTITPDFYALVNNNCNAASAAIVGLMISSSDTLSGTSPGGTPGYAGPIDSPSSTETSVFLFNSFSAAYSKRYWWPEFTSTDTTLYLGQILIGNVVNPSIDANYDQPIEYDIEAGRIVNRTPGATDWVTRTHGTRRAWSIFYEGISTSDKDELETLFDDTQIDLPLVWTNDGGTNYYYAKIEGTPVLSQGVGGLWNVNFTLVEVIA